MTDTLCAQVTRRLCVPATPSELAASYGRTVHQMRGVLYQLKRQGRVRQTERRVGRERCWQANGTADDLHELMILDTYERFLEGEAGWPELVAMIARRSPRQVERMERAQGLR